jgi:hypothetical protein
VGDSEILKLARECAATCHEIVRMDCGVKTCREVGFKYRCPACKMADYLESVGIDAD